jgi:hypothetical protein
LLAKFDRQVRAASCLDISYDLLLFLLLLSLLLLLLLLLTQFL